MAIRNLYLIKRGERPAWHKAPYHPVIICTVKHVAQFEMGATDKHAWMWNQSSPDINPSAGWLLMRWNGFDIDYGHVVHNVGLMPDGSPCGFWRDYKTEKEGYISPLFAGAVWYSNKKMPEWLQKRGVVYPADAHTRLFILDMLADDGIMGAPEIREEPDFWPEVVEV